MLAGLISGVLCFSIYNPKVYHKSAFLTLCHSSNTYGPYVYIVIWAIYLKMSCEPREHFPPILKLWQNKYGHILAHICSAMPYLGHMCQIIPTCGPNMLAIWGGTVITDKSEYEPKVGHTWHCKYGPNTLH